MILLQHLWCERRQVELFGEGDGDDDALLVGRGQRRPRRLLRHLPGKDQGQRCQLHGIKKLNKKLNQSF